MRHLGSLLAGLVAMPAGWLLLAIGQPQTTSTIAEWVERNGFDTTALIGPIAYLAAAGLLLGLIACLRISPLGPLVAGTLLAALYVALFINPLRVIDAVPKPFDLGPVDVQLRVPVENGTLAVLACCLLVAVFSGKRWRRWPAPAPAEVPAAAEGFTAPPFPPQEPAPLALPAPQPPTQVVPAAEPPTQVVPGTVAPAAATPGPELTTVAVPETPPAAPSPPSAPAATAPDSPTGGSPDVAAPPSAPPPLWPPLSDETSTPVPTETASESGSGTEEPGEQPPTPDEQSGRRGRHEQGRHEQATSPWSVPPRSPLR